MSQDVCMRITSYTHTTQYSPVARTWAVSPGRPHLVTSCGQVMPHDAASHEMTGQVRCVMTYLTWSTSPRHIMWPGEAS